VNLVFFYYEIKNFSVTTEWQHWWGWGAACAWCCNASSGFEDAV